MHRFIKKRKRDTLVRVEKRVKHLSRNRLAESFGWIGTIALLVSYALLSLDIISGDSLIYHALILIGSVALAVITYRHRAFQSFMVNFIFGIIAVATIIRLVFFV